MPWEAFRRLVDATCIPDGDLAPEMKYVRTEAARLGDALGHWEAIDTSTARRIVVAPPVLARLPWPGLPRAVLCGSRSPDTVTEIQEVCESVGGLLLSSDPQRHHPYAATRLELSGESEEHMIALARELSIRYDRTPVAWSIARSSGSIDSYLDALQWEERGDLNWDRRDFDPEFLRFGSNLDGADRSRLRLIEYSHPSGWAWRNWLRSDGASADVDRSWGRYCVLASVGRVALQYDHRTGIATVPRQVPLPKLHARALALSSGRAPALVPGSGIGLRSYPSVPRPVLEVVAAKLQQDRPKHEHADQGTPV